VGEIHENPSELNMSITTEVKHYDIEKSGGIYS